MYFVGIFHLSWNQSCIWHRCGAWPWECPLHMAWWDRQWVPQLGTWRAEWSGIRAMCGDVHPVRHMEWHILWWEHRICVQSQEVTWVRNQMSHFPPYLYVVIRLMKQVLFLNVVSIPTCGVSCSQPTLKMRLQRDFAWDLRHESFADTFWPSISV